jgi:predicted branched-subunit amino acid permease
LEGKSPAPHYGALGEGLADGVPIALGYLAVSFAFGIFAAKGGMAVWTATFLSLTNLTSAGQFAGTSLIFVRAPWLEIGLTTLLINIRYLLMSLSLSQKLRPGTGFLQRLLIGYGVTDEIYAVAAVKPGDLGAAYMAGLIALPVAGWTGGTLLGAAAGQILPDSLRSALGIALFAMFVAIVTPQARQRKSVRLVVALAGLLSLAGTYLPFLSSIPTGWRLIVCTLLASLAGALLAPVASQPSGGEAPDG